MVPPNMYSAPSSHHARIKREQSENRSVNAFSGIRDLRRPVSLAADLAAAAERRRAAREPRAGRGQTAERRKKGRAMQRKQQTVNNADKEWSCRSLLTLPCSTARSSRAHHATVSHSFRRAQRRSKAQRASLSLCASERTVHVYAPCVPGGKFPADASPKVPGVPAELSTENEGAGEGTQSSKYNQSEAFHSTDEKPCCPAVIRLFAADICSMCRSWRRAARASLAPRTASAGWPTTRR